MSVLAQPAPEPGSAAPPDPPLPRTSVLLMVLLTVVTLGIYVPVWYLRRLRAFNALRSTVKVTAALPVAALVLQVVGFGTAFGEALFEGLGIPAVARLAGAADSLVNLASLVVFLVLSFKVRDVLQDHLRAGIADYGGFSSVALQSQASLSGVWTFIFNAFYLQWKINQHHRELTSGSEA